MLYPPVTYARKQDPHLYDTFSLLPPIYPTVVSIL